MVCLFEGDKAGFLALVLGNQDHIVSLEEVFFCDEGHDILRVPRESTGFHAVDLVSRFCAVYSFAAVEDSGGAIVMKECDGLAGGVHLGESLSDFFPRSCEHNAGGYEEGKDRVDGDGCAADFLKAPCEVSVEKGCQYRKGEESGKGVGGILGGDEFEENIYDGEINEEELRRIRGISQIYFFAFPFLIEAVGNGEAPRGKADEVDDEVKVPFVFRRVFGDGCTEEVVDAEEV